MARIDMKDLGLIANYSGLMSLTTQYPHIQNLMTAMYNDRNLYSTFLASPVSLKVVNDDSCKGLFHVGLSFSISDKSVWMLYQSDSDSIDILVDDCGIQSVIKGYGVDLRCYCPDLIYSRLSSSTLSALGIDLIVVTNSELIFAKKK